MAASAPPPEPAIRPVTLGQPLGWLARGAADLISHPAASLFYGLCIAAAGSAILLAAARLPYLFTAAVSGFLLVAPILATGLYDLSRQREAAVPVRLSESMKSWQSNLPGLLGFAFFCLLAGTAWQMISVVIIALLYKGGAMVPLQMVIDILRDPQHMPLFMTYVGVGGLIAAVVFAVSVISVPMMLDRRCDLLLAMRTSVAAVAENPLPLALWATIIVLLSALGFATGLLGLVVIMPVLGHASWHAYRDLVAA